MSGFDTFQSRLVVTGQLVLSTPMRIGSGKSSEVTSPDQSVVKDTLGYPVIPGSSLKGVLRSHLESLLRAIEYHQNLSGLVCDLLSEDGVNACIPDQRIRKIREAVVANEISLAERDQIYLKESCLVCRSFGSPWLAAKLAIRDLPVNRDYWGEQYLVRDGVAIHRDKGTAAAQRKYTFEAIPAGTRFDFQMQVDNADDIELGLALFALHALEHEQVQVGGARSRGLGWCQLTSTSSLLYRSPFDLLLASEKVVLTPEDQQFYADAFLSAVRMK